MNKKDIRLEMAHRIRELQDWAPLLDPASPALAQAFRAQAAYIEEAVPRFDSFGASVMMGKVIGLVEAASVLMKEWYSRGSAP